MTLASPWLRRQQQRAYAKTLARLNLLMARTPSREPRKDRGDIMAARRDTTQRLKAELARGRG